MKQIFVYNQMDCFGCNWDCILTEDTINPFPCIENVSKEHVYKAIKYVYN